jgi:hypothetical protein
VVKYAQQPHKVERPWKQPNVTALALLLVLDVEPKNLRL